MPAPTLSLKGRALRLLSQREHSRAELERKLAPHAGTLEELTRALDELTAKGLISEARVAASVLHRRAPRLGSARVLQELRAKGVSADTLQEAAETLRATEQSRAQAVWQKKFGAPATDPADRARQARFLAARGFSADVVRRVLRAAVEDSPSKESERVR
ncbi:MAG: recombination regulator RecX [Comamonadaceae bacterium]|nr:recombination regulator RecX [Comamonadaceae bacterium]RRD56694.1 recombination regulator RecX [Comamonadaceae bacterium OH2545_COT-014]